MFEFFSNCDDDCSFVFCRLWNLLMLLFRLNHFVVDFVSFFFSIRFHLIYWNSLEHMKWHSFPMKKKSSFSIILKSYRFIELRNDWCWTLCVPYDSVKKKHRKIFSGICVSTAAFSFFLQLMNSVDFSTETHNIK